ncbi:MAG TPA: FAD/NAD(P)-binding oxidoreductase [bacterium]|nr:FAD/NAD(P)-binding oxidoreductase [bacterium]
MAGAKLVILGGGFGGITAALALRKALDGNHAITLVDRRPTFMMGLRKLWVLAGRGTIGDGTRSLSALREKGIDLRQGTVTQIDPAARRVTTDAGALPYDYLVIALGAESRPDLVPGFSSSVFDLYDAVDVERLAPRVKSFTAGRVVVGILGVPYKCPPAPYEAALLLHDVFEQRGVRRAIQIAAFTPQPMSLPVVGTAGCAQVEGRLAASGITFMPGRKVDRLEASTAITEKGSIAADLFIAVPPHRPPAVIKNSGLQMTGEWLFADPATMRTSDPRVYGVGDVIEIPLANKMSLPKAGIFAESQAKVAASHIASDIAGSRSPASFDGWGFCFIEIGNGQAAKVQGHFTAPNGPQVEITAPSEAALKEKVEFERSRLTNWFS